MKLRRALPDSPADKRERLAKWIVALVVVAFLSFLCWRMWPRGSASSASSATPASSSDSGKTANPSATPSLSTPAADRALAASLGCQTTPKPFVPTKLSISRINLDAAVISVTAKSSNGTMAPPLNQPWQVAWLAETAKPGASVGVVNFTAHTYHAGDAIGNALYSTNPLRTGDIIKVSDDHGDAACYRFTKVVKFSAAAYQASSTAFYDAGGTPELRLMACWDYRSASSDWASRLVFHADPLAH